MDPSRTPPSSEAEDDIIELTDIVTKGSVPSAPGDAGDGDNALESLMADLLTGNEESPAAEEEDFDLDALLKSSGLDDEGGLAGAGAVAPASAAASPAESSAVASRDSADMGDVDALLRDLVAPEQPTPASPEAQSASGADFGAVLQASAESMGTVQQAPAGDAGTESEVDVDDLDSLLASIMDPETADAPPQSSAAPVAAPAADLGDLDALLAEPQPDPQQSASPSAGPSPKVPEQASAHPATAKQPAAPSAVKASAVEPGDALDLDTLLGEAPAKAQIKAPAKAPVSAPVPDAQANIEADDDPLSGLDELLAASENIPAGANGLPETDLDDPLLVGEADAPAPDHDVMRDRAGTVSASIAAVQKKMADLAAGADGADVSVFAALRECVEDLATEVQDLAESYASGLAAAEARISALEAELAAGGATSSMSGDMARLEQRLEAVETSVEKAAAEAAARLIREEITALLAEMGQEL